MLGAQLAFQMKYGSQALRIRAWALAAVSLLIGVWLVWQPRLPSDVVLLTAWTQFFLAIFLGGSLTGWRVTQMPKSRTAEFLLVTPRTDGELVLGEILGGLLRTAFVVGAASPLILAMVGKGWITGLEGVALIVIPILCGWTAGLGLAVVAYAPLWFRRLTEAFVLLTILAYMLFIGLLGPVFIPWALSLWLRTTNSSLTILGRPVESMRYFNPFRLLGMLGQTHSTDLVWQFSGVVALLGGFCLFAVWFLGHRLRKHYLEENYGEQYRKDGKVPPIRDNPLAWWTARRVSRFRGNVNLYLGWGTIFLYSGWLLAGNRWPVWLGSHLMLVFEALGGAAMLGAAAVQFALVPVGFLSGLWDSNPQQRLGRLELLLITPLTAWDFLEGSIAASWTRGKWYLGAALCVWIAAALSPRQPWFHLGTLALLVFSATCYVVLFFAIAYRSFASVGTDRASATLGLTLTVAWPLLTLALFRLKWGAVAALMPLGGLYLLGRSPVEQARLTGLPAWGAVLEILLANVGYLVVAILLIRRGLARFEDEIHTWFADHLVAGQPRTRAPRKPRGASEPTASEPVPAAEQA